MLPSNQTWHVTVHTFLVLCQISSFYSFSFSSKLDCILLLTEIQPKEGKHFALNNHNCYVKLLVGKNLVWVKWSGEERGRGGGPDHISQNVKKSFLMKSS